MQNQSGISQTELHVKPCLNTFSIKTIFLSFTVLVFKYPNFS